MRARRLVLAVALLVVAAGCVQISPPVRTTDDYEHKATSTADAARSAVETALVLIESVDDGNVFGPYGSVVLSESENAASGAQATFDSIQPPPTATANQLRNTLDPLLDQAVSELATVRVEARRGRLERTVDSVGPLRRISGDLATFSERHQ